MSDKLSLIVKNAIEESLDLKKLVLHQKLYKVLVEYVESRLIQEGFLKIG